MPPDWLGIVKKMNHQTQNQIENKESQCHGKQTKAD